MKAPISLSDLAIHATILVVKLGGEVSAVTQGEFHFDLTSEETLDPEFVALCKSVTDKRPRVVIDHILKHGYITTEDLSTLYGYDHPPRAIGDVRENGIPLETHFVTSKKTGRKIGAYTFGDPKDFVAGRIGGRRAFPKQFKQALIERYSSREAFTGEILDERYLQIDHRIPYVVAGDGEELNVEAFMLIDSSSQRSKSWSCEHCDNVKKYREEQVCRRCFWAYPEDYEHVAMVPKRRLELSWSGPEVGRYETLKQKSIEECVPLPEYVKRLLSE